MFIVDKMDNLTTPTTANITASLCRIAVPTVTLAFTIVSCSLSILGSAVIIITYVNVHRIRNFTRKLLLSLTVADLFTAVGNLTGSVRYIALVSEKNGCHLVQTTDSVCVIQSFVTTYSSMASFFWTAIIALHIFMQIRSGTSRMRTGMVLIGYQVFCWGVTGIIAVTALVFNVLGSDKSVGTGSWCWIESQINDDVQVLWMVISGKGWEILCYILTAGLYMLSKIAIWVKRRERNWRRFEMHNVEDMRNEDENFLYVPLVLYVLRLWGTVRFIIAVTNKHVNSVHLDRAQKVLLAFQGIGDSGQAFCNCILFCFCDETVRDYLFSVLFRRCRGRISYSEINERTSIRVQA